MKYNLKNRPKWCNSNDDYWNRWFEGFEKELRERLFEGLIEIKEILGE